jgi:hypothetical protein
LRVSETFERGSKRNRRLRWARRVFLAFAVAVIGIVALVYFSQHSMLYHPRP